MSRPPVAGHEERLQRYLVELRGWAPRVNLVGSLDDDALRRHIEESLQAARHLPDDVYVADLGSGAGFPGLPVAIARPDLHVTLVESRERRIHFLRHVRRVLELDCRILRTRLEDPPEQRFDFSLIRAVAPLAESLRLGELWTRPSGEIWVWSRERGQELGAARLGTIDLGAGGRILRVRPAAVSRGTP